MKTIPGILALALSIQTTGLLACGLDWSLPTNHFQGVDQSGYLSYWQSFGELKLQNGLIIPLHANFNSSRTISSPYLGKGWMLPLLDSHVEPVDENTRKVLMPDGWTFTFYRNGTSDTWRGNSGWEGMDSGKIFKIAAPCGAGMSFENGRVSEISTADSQVIHYNWENDMVKSLDINGEAVVTVSFSETLEPKATTILLGDQTVVFHLQLPPPSPDTSNPSLVAATYSNHDDTFAYSSVSGRELLTVTHDKVSPDVYTWDSKSNRLLSDGMWTYDYTDHGGALGIERKDGKGGIEYFEDQASKGYFISQDLNQPREITKFFLNGPASGRIRSVEILGKDSSTIPVQKNDYDAGGNLIREHSLQSGKPEDIVRTYDKEGHETEMWINGVLFSRYTYSNGQISTKIYSDGTKVSYVVLPDNILRETTIAPGGVVRVVDTRDGVQIASTSTDNDKKN